MKNLIFVLILLCIAAASYGQSFRYDKVIVREKGNDFGFDNTSIKTKSGNIIIKADRISIDFKRYKIKRQISDNLYKTRGGTIQYVFNEDENLQAVRVHRFNMDYYYSIKSDKAVVAVNVK